MTLITTWRTDDSCPACGTQLNGTDTAAVVCLDCPACGWSFTGQAGDAR